MPAATRLGDSNTGHDLCPPVALTSASSDVLINGIGAGRVGDSYAVHGCKSHPDHSGAIASGSATVFINGKAAGRVGDPVSCGGSVAAGSSNVFIGDGKSVVEVIDASFQMNREILENSATPLNTLEDIMLATPDIAANMATKQDNENDALAWSELSTMLKKWFQRNAYVITTDDVEKGLCDVYITSLTVKWARAYERFEKVYQDILTNGLGEAGQNLLVKRLKSSYVWNTGGEFDFSQVTPAERDQWYFNSRVVERGYTGADGMNAALAAHSIKVLAAGNVELQKDGVRKITVNDVYVYIQDRFNFEIGTGILDNYLGFWSKEKLDYMSAWIGNLASYRQLENQNFEQFRNKYRKGGDFEVLSPLYRCPEFSEMSYLASESDSGT